jgi:hypothetical protein
LILKTNQLQTKKKKKYSLCQPDLSKDLSKENR